MYSIAGQNAQIYFIILSKSFLAYLREQHLNPKKSRKQRPRGTTNTLTVLSVIELRIMQITVPKRTKLVR